MILSKQRLVAINFKKFWESSLSSKYLIMAICKLPSHILSPNQDCGVNLPLITLTKAIFCLSPPATEWWSAASPTPSCCADPGCPQLLGGFSIPPVPAMVSEGRRRREEGGKSLNILEETHFLQEKVLSRGKESKPNQMLSSVPESSVSTVPPSNNS